MADAVSFSIGCELPLAAEADALDRHGFTCPGVGPLQFVFFLFVGTHEECLREWGKDVDGRRRWGDGIQDLIDGDKSR